MHYETKEIMELACKAGKIVLENGGEIYRVEQTMTSVCAAYGLNGYESFATPTIIILSASDAKGEPHSRMMRITTRSINLDKIASVNDFSRKLPIEIGEALTELTRIEESTPYPNWVRVLVSGIGVGAFAVIFGGGFRDIIGGLFLGALIRMVVFALQKKRAGDFMVNLVGGGSAALGGWLINQINPMTDHWVITVSAMMLLVPGLLFTNAMRDIAAGDLVSGSSRGIEVLSIAAALACGAAAVYAVLSLVGGGLP